MFSFILSKNPSIPLITESLHISRNSTAYLIFQFLTKPFGFLALFQAKSRLPEQNLATLTTSKPCLPLVPFNDHLKHLIDTMPGVIFSQDDHGRWLMANESAKHLFQLDKIDWLGKTNKELMAQQPRLYNQFRKFFSDDESVWNHGKPIVFEENIINDKNNPATYEIHKQPFFQHNGQRQQLITIGLDITDRKHTEQKLRVADIAIEAQEAIVITDADKHVIRINKAFTKLTGYTAQEVMGKPPSVLQSTYHNSAFYQTIHKSLAKKNFWQGEIWDRRKNGNFYLRWVTITGVTDANGQIVNYVIAFTNISEHKEAEEAIHRLAFYDPLTGLPNRRFLNDRLQQALILSSKDHYHGAVLMIDLDNFKTINDTKGHEIGDHLLVEVAGRLKSCIRQSDTVSRLGGDEFVIILEKLSKELEQARQQAQYIGEKILKLINQPFAFADCDLHSSPSIGICLFHEHKISTNEILKRADAAMYQAKNANRNTLRFYDPDMQAALESRINIESELHYALTHHQFRLYYQMQIDNSGNIFGAEALIRWEHPQRGLIFPDQFISLAEESGAILSIGNWVLRTACAQLKRWENNPLTAHLVLAVNVTPLQFRQPKFVEQLSTILTRTGIKATQLKLEFTESIAIIDIADTVKKMEKLRSLGISFSMDDFGTGYSSLSYLRKLPLSQLKIDRSFVRDIVTDPCDAAIVQTILTIAKTLELDVIAEGVENEKQLTCLESFGCPAYQGYFFGKAVPIEEFEKYITQANYKPPVVTEHSD